MGIERIASTIDEMDVAETLEANVVSPGAEPRLHGYDVQGDLARHFDFGEVVLIALTGEAPSESVGRAFNILLNFMASITVAEAPAHAAVLSRMCGAQPSGVFSVAAIGLAEQARLASDRCQALYAWLDGGRAGEAPAGCAATDAADAAAVARLGSALSAAGQAPHAQDGGLSLPHAITAALYDCGVRAPWQREIAHIVARLPAAAAEAMAARPGNLRNYPIRVPPFEIVREVP